MIRRLLPTDKDALQRLRLSLATVSLNAAESLDDVWRNMSEAKIEALLPDNETDNLQILFGAFLPEKDDLVGVVGLRREPRPTTRHKASLWGLAVLPEQRRQGIGTQLVAALVQEGKRLPGLEMIRLSITADNLSAVRLLQKQGFQIYVVEPRSRFLDGAYYDQTYLHQFVSPVGDAISGKEPG